MLEGLLLWEDRDGPDTHKSRSIKMIPLHHDFAADRIHDNRCIERNIRIDQQEYLRRQAGNLASDTLSEDTPTAPASCPERR